MTENRFKYLSVCSGIESATVAWEPLGWEAIAFSEIDPFCSAVLEHHYPNIINLGDFTEITKHDIQETTPDLLVGGTPCQSFSISGLRGGLREDRGNLALEFIRLAQRLHPTWILWENVTGVLSSEGGRDFGTFLGGLAECGYGTAYRVLDTQYIRTERFPRAIPQRRRRVFVVGYLGDWRNPAKVLFDGEALSSNNKPSRKQRETSSRSTTHRITRSDKYVQDEIASTVRARDWKEPTDLVINPDEPMAIHAGNTNANGIGLNQEGVSYTWTANDRHSVYCFEPRSQDGVPRIQKEPISPTLNAMKGGQRQPCVFMDGVVPRNKIIRRLTPLECERLQGFPDNFTQIPYRGKSADQCPIAPRYEALGNSMSVNVMEFLGKRIEAVEKSL